MKRSKVIYPKIRKFRPIMFIYACRFCNKEFKRNIGFKILDIKPTMSYNENPLYESYCCNECAKTEQEVLDLIKKHDKKHK